MNTTAIEDILPLSPLQQGFLYHALYDEQAVDLYTVQLIVSLNGPLSEKTLRASAVALLRRHANLRAYFEYQNVDRPVQIILREVPLAWELVDLSPLHSPQKEQSAAQFLEQDQQRRFDPRRAPLLRFTLIRFAEHEHWLVITHHHILLDGWSVPVLIDELIGSYRQGGIASGLPPVTRYRRYLEWIAAQDREAARRAWKAELAGIEPGTRIAPSDATQPARVPQTVRTRLSEALTRSLTRVLRAKKNHFEHRHPGRMGDDPGAAAGPR